jgi:hypothetical protein
MMDEIKKVQELPKVRLWVNIEFKSIR